MSEGQAGPSPAGGPSRRVVEVATAVVAAVVVASGVVAVGVVTRDDPQNTAAPGSGESPSEEPEPTEPESSPAESEPEDEPTEPSQDGPAGQFRPEVTEVELAVDQPEYTGPCPVTLTFSARVTTSTGPVRADVEWRNADSTEVQGESIQFGGPGPDAAPVPQGVTITHEVEVADDAAVERTVHVVDPNEVTSNPVQADVTCTPYAEITKGGDNFEATPADGSCHELHFEATITVPHDMTVTYEWLRSDGADVPDPGPVVFGGGGAQTQSVPGQVWNLGDLDGQFGFQIHIIEPFDVTSDLVAYDVTGCSGPAA